MEVSLTEAARLQEVSSSVGSFKPKSSDLIQKLSLRKASSGNNAMKLGNNHHTTHITANHTNHSVSVNSSLDHSTNHSDNLHTVDTASDHPAGSSNTIASGDMDHLEETYI
jgi:hypothetical protein